MEKPSRFVCDADNGCKTPWLGIKGGGKDFLGGKSNELLMGDLFLSGLLDRNIGEKEEQRINVLFGASDIFDSNNTVQSKIETPRHINIHCAYLLFVTSLPWEPEKQNTPRMHFRDADVYPRSGKTYTAMVRPPIPWPGTPLSE